MECSKKTVTTRREAVRLLVAASVGAIMPASISGASEPVHGAYDFASVRERILKAVENGKATGVAVAVAQGGRIVWEEGFGWAMGGWPERNRPYSIPCFHNEAVHNDNIDDAGSRGKTFFGRASQQVSSGLQD